MPPKKTPQEKPQEKHVGGEKNEMTQPPTTTTIKMITKMITKTPNRPKTVLCPVERRSRNFSIQLMTRTPTTRSRDS